MYHYLSLRSCSSGSSMSCSCRCQDMANCTFTSHSAAYSKASVGFAILKSRAVAVSADPSSLDLKDPASTPMSSSKSVDLCHYKVAFDTTGVSQRAVTALVDFFELSGLIKSQGCQSG